MSKLQLSPNKVACLQKLSDENGIISALAFDQRGALKRLMAQYQTEEPTVAQMEELKVLVADELTKYASSMLLDPEYGLPATKALDPNAGLLLAYEKTGYDTTSTKRLPDCLDVWSAKRIKEQGADAVKFLLYYDVDSSDELNQQKQAYIERIGSECVAEDIPFFLEILAYDEKIADAGSAEYAKVKPHKVIGAMKVFSDPRFNIDVLKVEVPVNVKYVEGFGDGEIVHTREEAAAFFKAQDEATNLAIHLLECRCVSETLPRNTCLCPRIRRKLQRRSLWPCYHGLDQLKPTSKMVKQQLVNGCVQLDLRTLTNSTRFFKQQRLHGKNVWKHKTSIEESLLLSKYLRFCDKGF